MFDAIIHCDRVAEFACSVGYRKTLLVQMFTKNLNGLLNQYQ